MRIVLSICLIMLAAGAALGADTAPAKSLADEIPKDAVRQKVAGGLGRYTINYVRPGGNVVAKDYFDQNNVLIKRELFQNGRRHGLQRDFYPDGRLLRSEPFKAGIRDGVFKYWDSEGKLVANSKITNGTGTYLRYFPDGKLESEYSFKNNQMEGRAITFQPGGSLANYQMYKSGNVVGDSFSLGENGELGSWVRHADDGTVHGFIAERQSVRFFLKGKEVPKEKYDEARKTDKTLPESHEPDWYPQNIPEVIPAVIKEFKEKPPVKIPLDQTPVPQPAK